jgi:hypothetical protein
MASAIDDPTQLPGQTLHGQDGEKVGEVKQVFGIGDGEEPMWVTVEIETGLTRNRLVFVPVARIKNERDEVRVPYTAQHLLDSPEVETDGELSEQDDRALRNYYAIDLADEELRTDQDTYAAQIPDAEGPARELDGRD